MNNIHLIETNKPSMLGYLTKKGKEVYKDLRLYDNLTPNILDSVNVNMYIISDEEIKEGDWSINLNSPYAHKEVCRIDNQIELERYVQKTVNNCKKIILTDNKDLIKDGVQAIDDEFLEWFVKSPSCEFVEIESLNIGDEKIGYVICKPQEEAKQTDEKGKPLTYWGGLKEPKQDTLEEVAESRYGTDMDSIRGGNVYDLNADLKRGFIDGAKSDAAKDYWFEQFSKSKNS
jgi:hypothetical protein